MEKRGIGIIFVLGLLVLAGCNSETIEDNLHDGSQVVMEVDTPQGQVKIEGEPIPPTGGAVKEFDMTAKQWDFEPSTIEVNQGDTVKLHIESIDVIHGIALPAFGINENLEPGKTVDIEFVADKITISRFNIKSKLCR